MRNSTFKFLVVSSLSLGLGAIAGRAATYLELGGQVVVEAEHFDTRTVDPVDSHHWHIVPDDDNSPTDPLMDSHTNYNEIVWINARGGKYIQSYPDQAGGGQNKNNVDLVGTDPVVNYKVQIATTGQYRLYIRWGGYDGSSDSMYAQIVELIDGPGTGQPDWYRYVGNFGGNFSAGRDTVAGGSAIGWDGDGAPEGSANQVSGGGGEVAAVWTVSTAGTYTVRLSQREDGSSIDAFVLQLASLPEPDDPGPDESPIVGSTYVRITQQPADKAARNGQTATFSVVVASSTGAPTYQWQKAAPGTTNFNNIAGATSASITTPAVTSADDGTKYRVIASVGAQTTTSRAAKLTVDVTPPTVVKASGSDAFNKVTVTFSEAVDPATGTNMAYYSLSGGLTISGATLGAGGRSVVLATSTQTTNASYSLTVSNVTDVVGNVLSPNPTRTSFHGFVVGSGVQHKFFANITPNAIAGLTNNARFPNSPDFVTLEPLFEYPPSGGDEAGDNYGNELSGLLTAPLTGSYVFFTCSDDPSSLYLSTDADPAHKRLIAVEASWSNARSWNTAGGGTSLASDKRSDSYSASQWPTPNVINLTAGNKYYIEVLHTEGGGGDNVGVAWTLPGGTDPLDLDPPIPGSAVSVNYNPDSTVTISQQPQSANVQANTPVSFSVTATGSSDYGTNLNYQWQKAPPGGSFANIAGANQSSYAIPFVLTADNQSQFRVVVAALPAALPIDYGRTTSSVVTLTVTTDTTRPVVRGALSPGANTVLVKFTEPVAPGTTGNYTIPGIAVTGVVADPNDVTGVVLTTAALTDGTRYNLTVTGIVDRGGNTISPNPTTKQFLAQTYLVGGALGNASSLLILPTNEKLALGSLTTRGFLIHVYQNPAYNQVNTIAAAEDLLAGRLGPNLAATNRYVEPSVINYKRPIEADRGHFSSTLGFPVPVPDTDMPVIVPVGGAEDNFAFEILSYVELRSGIYRWGVSSDDGFRVSPATSVTDPNNALTMGVYDGGRGVGDTVFDFVVVEDGLYPIRLVYEEGGGDANVEWWSIPNVSEDAATGTLALVNFTDDPTALKAFQPPLATARPQITSATIAAGRITIRWSNGGTLESTPSLTSPSWTPTGNSSGTFSEAVSSSGNKFYRVKQ